MNIQVFDCLEDNYSFLITNPAPSGAGVPGGCSIVIDPTSDVTDRILKFVEHKGDTIKYVLNTHYHYDHVGGNKELKMQVNPEIIGPKYEKSKIPTIDKVVSDGDKLKLSNLDIHVLHVPGHSVGMVNYYIPEHSVLFTADCIFSVGCGRVAPDCTYSQMWESLKRLRDLPDETKIYFAHEYTQKNIEFAMTVTASKDALMEYKKHVDLLRKKNLPTVPTTMKIEKLINPFLRCDIDCFHGVDPKLSAVEKFTVLRKLKDS